MYRILRVELYAALLLTLLASTSAFAQTAATESVTLSELSVAGSAAPSAETRLPPAAQAASLTVPTVEQARADLQRTPGGVALVPDTVFKNRPAQTLKDVLDFVPGVIVQPRFGSDARLSIRGSGFSRNYGNRGINVFQDGIPINTSDGLVDYFEIDPTAYRYVEVFRGANALRFGANALGGAINLVTPTGRDVFHFDARIDAGSFGYLKGQAATGGVSGPFDYFLTLSADRFDGFREHSDGNSVRGNANFGYQFSPDAETRFYVNANTINQRIPGEVIQQSALTNPAPRIRSGSSRTSSATSTRCGSPTRPRCASTRRSWTSASSQSNAASTTRSTSTSTTRCRTTVASSARPTTGSSAASATAWSWA